MTDADKRKPISEQVEWVLQQIADDEAAAQRCPGTDFSIAEYPSRPGLFEVEAYAPGSLDRFDDVVVADGGARGIPEPYAQHVERWDPKRALTECDINREVLVCYRNAVFQASFFREQGLDPFRPDAQVAILGPIVRKILAIYADREGYPADWRP